MHLHPKNITLSKTEAKTIVLNAQGFNTSFSTPRNVIQQLGYIQIDTLAVASRAHHHVFHSRNASYIPEDLNVMLRNREVFEYWSHAASYLPMEDYKFSLLRKEEYSKGKSHWFEQDIKTTKFVLDRIKAEGPLQSKDFKDIRTEKQEWYAWKPAKIALEQLFMEGKIMVSERKNFQKVYDLTERVLPTHVETTPPTLLQFCEHLIIKTLNAQGLVTLNEISYLRKGIKTTLQKALNKLLNSNTIAKVSIESNPQIYYALSPIIEQAECVQVHILSPFDNLIIQRKRALDIFDFDYQIECYVPEKKRKFGYYCLPVLYGNQFAARFDPKADRKTGIFTVKSFWWENDFVINEDFVHAFADKLEAFIKFCGCHQLKISHAKKHNSLIEIEKLVNA